MTLKPINRRTCDWLKGQLDTIRVAAKAVSATVGLHCPEAVAELEDIQFACNRAHNLLDASDETKGGKR